MLPFGRKSFQETITFLPTSNSAVKKSAQLTLLEFSAKRVFTSISSLRTCSRGILLVQDKARRTRRFFAQLVQEHHHASLRIHKLTENDSTKKAVSVAELLVEAMNGGVKELFVYEKRIDLEFQAWTATIFQFVKWTDQWLSVTRSVNSAIKEIGDFENWMKIMQVDSQSINAAIHNIHRA